MHPLSFRRGAAVAFLCLATAAITQGCYAEVSPEPVYAEGYRPSFYDGYVVYYDGAGRPFYHVGGAPVWISERSPYYPGLVAHWHTYGGAYGGWYAHHGYRYRGYRGGGGRIR